VVCQPLGADAQLTFPLGRAAEVDRVRGITHAVNPIGE
jgi:hypothetical protein